jgi:hypothetical protein
VHAKTKKRDRARCDRSHRGQVQQSDRIDAIFSGERPGLDRITSWRIVPKRPAWPADAVASAAQLEAQEEGGRAWLPSARGARRPGGRPAQPAQEGVRGCAGAVGQPGGQPRRAWGSEAGRPSRWPVCPRLLFSFLFFSFLPFAICLNGL